MPFPSSDELEKKVGNKYSLVIAAAKRAKQLRDGAPRLVESKSRNLITIALEEIAAGKLIALDQDYKRLSGKSLTEGKRLTPATEQAFKDLGSKHSQDTAKPSTKVNPADGKTYYLHSDGKYYSEKG